jgi:XTP/dITP diphosphohydrolase
MRDLLVATRNKGKLEEFKEFFAGTQFVITSLDGIGMDRSYEPEETGETFEANAEIKAREYGTKAGMLTIADDSGLCVDALGGKPGVRSARYVDGSDADRYQAVLKEMQNVSDDKRTGQFVSVIAVFDPKTGRIFTTRGEANGHILTEARGERGFGYDPIFFADEIGKTYAEASLQEKASIDHRGKALKKAKEILVAEFA